MAEAIVEGPLGVYFCHECNREVQRNIWELKCASCDSEFIEEMTRSAQPTQAPAESRNPDSAQIAEMLSSTLFGMFGSAPSPQVHRHRYNTRSSVQNNYDVDSDDDEMQGVAPSAVFHFSSGDSPQPFHGILNYMLQRIGSDLGVHHPVILHGNPGDYAWGSGGLDAIISQLLNHLDGTGAPPALKERIDNLPRVLIEQVHVDNSLQCSICMDDFELAMEAKKLPCGHLYHSECINKWLEMHGTCPVCRKDLNGDDTSTDNFPEHSFQAGDRGRATSSRGPSTSSSFANHRRN